MDCYLMWKEWFYSYLFCSTAKKMVHSYQLAIISLQANRRKTSWWQASIEDDRCKSLTRCSTEMIKKLSAVKVWNLQITKKSSNFLTIPKLKAFLISFDNRMHRHYEWCQCDNYEILWNKRYLYSENIEIKRKLPS